MVGENEEGHERLKTRVCMTNLIMHRASGPIKPVLENDICEINILYLHLDRSTWQQRFLLLISLLCYVANWLFLLERYYLYVQVSLPPTHEVSQHELW